MLERVVEPMLRARDVLRAEYQVLHRAVLAIVREDAVCRRLMTVPGVGALVAITFTSAIDDPARFRRSRAVRSEEHTSELQSRQYLVCRLLLEKKKNENHV